MTIEALLNMITLVLILLTLLLTLAIILRTDKKICNSHKFLFAGFIIFGIVKIFEMLDGFQIIYFLSLYSSILEIVFVLLFILGFWKIHDGIKEVINHNSRKIKNRK